MKKNKFKNLDLTVKFAINSFNSGAMLSILKDSTSEIDLVRQYTPEDKKLDSKASLKTNLLMSKVFNPERELTFYIFLDISRSCSTKEDFFISVCLYLNYISNILSNKICLITSKEVISPTNDNDLISFALEKLYVNGFDGKSNLDLSYLNNLSLENALIFLISDFTFDIPDKFFRTLSIINSVPTNKSISVAFFNSLELEFANGNFLDLETGNSVNWNGKNILDYYNSYFNDLKNKLLRTRTNFLVLDGSKNYLNEFRKYLLRI